MLKKSQLTLSALIFSLLCVSTAWAVPITPDLLYYTFDEGTGTTTANLANPGVGNDPAIVNGHVLTATGLSGTGLGLPGGGFVDTGWVTALGSGDWTLSLWLNFDGAASNSQFGYLFGDNSAGAFRAFTNGAAGVGNVYLRGPLGQVRITGGALQNGGNLLTWVYDSVNLEIRSYLNATLNSTVAQAALNINGSAPFRVGGYSGGGSPTGAVMDEFRLYSSALNQLQITELLVPHSAIPTPATLALFGLGLVGLGWSRRKKA